MGLLCLHGFAVFLPLTQSIRQFIVHRRRDCYYFSLRPAVLVQNAVAVLVKGGINLLVNGLIAYTELRNLLLSTNRSFLTSLNV